MLPYRVKRIFCKWKKKKTIYLYSKNDQKTNHIFQYCTLIFWNKHVHIFILINYWSQNFRLVVTHMCPCLHADNHVVLVVIRWRYCFWVFVLPLIHRSSPGVHEEIPDRGRFKSQLPSYSHLHFFRRPFRFLMYNMKRK